MVFPCDRPCLQLPSAVQRKMCCSRQRCFYSVFLQRVTLRCILCICPYSTVHIFYQNQPHLSSFFCCLCVTISIWHHSGKNIQIFCVFFIVVVDCQTDAATDFTEGGSGLVKRQTSCSFNAKESVWRKVDSLRCSSLLLPAGSSSAVPLFFCFVLTRKGALIPDNCWRKSSLG